MLQYNNPTPNSTPGKATSGQQPIPADVHRALLSISKEDKDGALIFFEKSADQVEIYAEGAEFMAVLQPRNPTSKTSEGIAKCSYNQAQFRSCLRDIFAASGWRKIEVWEWSNVRKSWKCSKAASSGNSEQLDCYFEGNGNDQSASADLAMATAPVVTAVVVGGNGRVGLAFADSVNLIFGLTEFPDNELFLNLEVALIQLGAVECIIPSSLTGIDRIKEIAKNCEISLSPYKVGEFADNSVREIAKIIAGSEFVMMEHPALGLKAASGLMSYMNLLGLDRNLNAFKYTPYNLEYYLKLDDTALKSLHVFNGSSGQKFGSLYSLLNQCRTVQGGRLLDQWLRQPLRSKDDINSRLDAVEAFVENSSIRQNLRETSLRAVPDLSRILKRLLKGSANLQDIVVIYQVVTKIPSFLAELEALSSSPEIASRYVQSFTILAESLSKYTEMVENMVDFAALERHEYIVRADFDEALQEISQQKDAILGEIEPEFERVSSQLGLEINKKVKLERNAIYGYFFRISRLDAGLLKDEEYQQLATQKNGVYFVTPLLRDLSLRYDELCQLYSSKQSVLVKEMLLTTAGYRTIFDQLNLLIADLDVCLSLAYVSVMSPKSFVRPQIGGSDLILKGARHPCIEGQTDFIANDVKFKRAEDNQSGSVCQIITGPNMGGKSTYIRQTALIVIMAQLGCFVPCDSAVLPIFDSVMVRVGAGDSIIRGISTFMAEMLETASILKTATKNSFVIIDELGRGTSTSEGLGLAWGVTKYIATKIGCYTFFATHFHELTVLATELPHLISNLHVSAQVYEGSMTMLYAVKPGVCDQSFGIHVAELARFPPLVVKLAKLKNAELEGLPILQFQSPDEETRAAQMVSNLLQLPESDQRAALNSAMQDQSTPLALRELFSPN